MQTIHRKTQLLHLKNALSVNYMKINSDASLLSNLKNIPDTQVASIAVCIQKFNEARSLIAVTHRQYPIIPESYFIQHKQEKSNNNKTPHFERIVETVKMESEFKGIFQVEALGLIEAIRCARAELAANPEIKKIDFIVDNKSLADMSMTVLKQGNKLQPEQPAFRDISIIERELKLLRSTFRGTSIKILFKHREFNKEADRNASQAVKFALDAVNSISEDIHKKHEEEFRGF